LLVVLGCSQAHDASLTVVLDSNPAREMREVIAVPVDPASVATTLPRDAPLSRAHEDSTTRLTLLRDSATALDQRFQAEREALNKDSRALDTLARRSAEYSRRFDAFRHRALAADSLRTARDRLRARVAPLATKLTDADAFSDDQRQSLRAKFGALTAGTRRAVVKEVRGDTARLTLDNGEWWIGVARSGSVPARWTRLTVPHTGVVPLGR
jgi:hypothetical protein